MFHRYNTSYKKKFLKNFRSRVYVYVLRTLIALRFHRLQRHHKVAVLVASIGIFFVGIVTIVLSFSSDSVLAQIRFKIAIRLIPQCQNGIDDDGDTLIDYPLDPGCENTLDTSEGAPFVPPTVVCFAPVSQGITSQSMTWIAIPSNGNGTYTYSWSGTDWLTGTTASVNKEYSSVGTKTAALVVTSWAFSSAVTPCVNSISITSLVEASPAAGTYTATQSITLTATWSTSIHYTTDGSTPTCSSTLYTAPISITSTKTLKAISCYPNSTYSPVVSFLYTINISSSGAGGGGWWGGGGWAVITPPKPPIVTPDKTPPLDAAPPWGGEDVISHPDCVIPTPESTFQDYKDYLVCDTLITPRVAEEQYEYEKYTARKELLWVAVELALKDKTLAIREGLERLTSVGKPVLISDASSPRPFHFFDVGLEWQPEWIAKTVEKGVILGLISTENNLFRPDDNVTRAEAFGMLMKATCMNPDESIYPTWEERVYATAKRYNLTVRSWKNFQSQSSILRQELFVITPKIDLWRDYTGGCTPQPVIKPLPPILQVVPIVVPPLSSAPQSSSSANNTPAPTPNTPSVTPIQEMQKPGTFVLLYENETEKVYAYIIKSGGIPDGVRAQYIRVFSWNKSTGQRLSIHDIAGVEYAEDRWLLGGEMVYITYKK